MTHTPCLKITKQNYFCCNFVKFPPTLAIFGTTVWIYTSRAHFPPRQTHVNAETC